ncbi:ImmA/IrrE family metallo-endopeptidase [Roseateles chitosanitabidus]|uniref:ImmA/IrrE family metallo-endopeptidase n=1 Tax=Roseateles chitosanitabidus TaxID=65048 RepID=UPI00083184F2|nr:ImmA/IrrE family metallo-endopeptidase [Roseateles chitosanitabidus]
MEGNEALSGPVVKWPVDLSHMQPEDAAEWLVAQYGDRVMPIKPEHIAQRLGVKLGELTVQPLGSVTIDPDGTPWILVDLSIHVYEQRFAVAHALGQIVLRQLRPPSRPWELFERTSIEPVETPDQPPARFAASLLVPREDLRWCVTSGWMRNATQIERTLGVSMSVLNYRYAQLLAESR